LVSDVTTTLEELTALGVSFLSINEALDFTTPLGKAMSGLLAVFTERIFSESELLLESRKPEKTANLLDVRKFPRPRRRKFMQC
jgi:hypothetical protein